MFSFLSQPIIEHAKRKKLKLLYRAWILSSWKETGKTWTLAMIVSGKHFFVRISVSENLLCLTSFIPVVVALMNSYCGRGYFIFWCLMELVARVKLTCRNAFTGIAILKSYTARRYYFSLCWCWWWGRVWDGRMKAYIIEV